MVQLSLRETELNPNGKPMNRVTPEWVKSMCGLNDALKDGLNPLFQDVFGAPPYNEMFTDDKVDAIFTDYLAKGADILLLRENRLRQPVAFMVGMPLSGEFQSVANIPPLLFDGKTAYIAEDGVAQDWRRNGISSFMKDRIKAQLRAKGYDRALLRTRADNVPQMASVVKSGGCTIDYAQQMVDRNTRDGVIREDNRFFLFDLTVK